MFFKSWQDFEKLRNHKKILIIYGAGVSGKHFLNVNKVIPNYFVDKKFAEIKDVFSENKKHKIPCISPRQMENLLGKRTADIIVANSDVNVLKMLLTYFKKIDSKKDTIAYFYHKFDVNAGSGYSESYKKILINGKFAFGGEKDYNFFDNPFNFLTAPDYLFKEVKKNAFHNTNFLTKEKIIATAKRRNIRMIFKDNRIRTVDTIQYNTIQYNTTIYLIGACYFANYFSQDKFRLESILINMLNKGKKKFNIEHIKIFGFHEWLHLFNLLNTPLKKNSIVIVNSITKPELLLMAKNYCDKYNCRFIAYMRVYTRERKNPSYYEKLCVKKCTIPEYKDKNRPRLRKELLEELNFMDIEAYEPPKVFFESKKTLALDASGHHLGDYGNEIIAKHLYDIITEKIIFKKDYKKDVEIAMLAISALIPEIHIYLAKLKREKSKFNNCGAIVMNCNPFTFGHLHLIEYSAKQVEFLYVFVVEEDKSQFPFKDRFSLVKKNTEHLRNIRLLPSGRFIISNTTFNEYFSKAELTKNEQKPDVSLDLTIFAAAIAPALNIKTRFVGEEPLDPVTKHYNEQMKVILPKYGCELVEIKRKENSGAVISASRVRKLLEQKKFKELKKLVPKETFEYLISILRR